MQHGIATLVTCLVALGGSLAWCAPAPPPLTHEIYIWQQGWTPALRAAVTTARPECAGFVPLAARIAWHGATPAITWPDVSWAAVAGERRSGAAAIRVEPLPSKLATQPAACDAITATALECIRRAASRGVALTEIQLDFDAAESQLAIYTDWVARLKDAVAPRRVTFTALPCWLSRPTFKALACAGDGYVLQVHAAEKPTPEATWLCDPEQARRWVRQAALAAPGVSFRVALPTYTYEFAFAPDNACLGVVAEGENRAWPADSRVVFLRADPASLARLRDTWNAERPAELTGVLWYRLPIATDVRNWRWPTLRTLIRGGFPQAALAARASLDADGRLCDLILDNTGDADATPPAMITVSWQNSTCTAGDPLSGYGLTTGPASAVFKPRGDAGGIIRPGQSLALGWLRFTKPVAATALTFSIE